MRRSILTTSLCLLFVSTVALADWDPGDGHKMHFPQLPNPHGWDVLATKPKVLADDWKCSESGPVKDIHLWGSWKQDVEGVIANIHVSIHANIPETPTSPSMPGKVLWERDFGAGEFTYRPYGTGQQGWYNPNTGDYKIPDHSQFHQINITKIRDPFSQKEGRIYWLAVWVTVEDSTGKAEWGWKTTNERFMDDAVWGDIGVGEVTWKELYDPAGNSLDLAFVITTKKPVRPHIALDALEQWQEALRLARVIPLDPNDWGAYMAAWNNTTNEKEGEPYPDNAFLPAQLYAWPGDPCPTDASPGDASSTGGLRSPGLVMAWGSPQMPAGSYSSAWTYKYPADPDLTDVTITVTVHPPCDPCMSTVSFGMRGIFGNHRAWHWDVPGTLPCGVGTTITIDTALVGLGAANPAADGYMSDVGFDITQVEVLLFDENCIWVDEIVVPPPGDVVPRAWNYWYDLIITPKPVKTIGPVKWSQPPVEAGPGIFIGWDERSIRYFPPLMADDWRCKDQRPVTDIHWWGSFLGWAEADEPPQMPDAFHFGIWTDVPKDPDDYRSFSHPGKMIWEHICSDYNPNFVGYNKDPRQPSSTAPIVHDSCFQFYCELPETNWFKQKPDPGGQGRIYWLSIAAIYPSGTTPEYPWGWKTRPKWFQDDAVRIFRLEDGSWPPSIGAKWLLGRPVEYPRWVSWDLSFELTTNKEDPPPVVDFNFDWVIDFRDLAFFARWWLADLTDGSP